MTRGLFINFCILVTLTFLMSFTLHVRLRLGNEWKGRFISWLTFTAGGLVLMQFPIYVAPGVFFDLRTVLPALAGFGGGFGAALPVAVTLAAYRLLLGGAGVVAGITNILAAAVLGALLGHGQDVLTRPLPKLVWRVLVLFAAANLTIGLVPETGLQILRDVYPTLVLFYTLGLTVCLSIFRIHYHADRSLKEMGRMAHTDALTELLNMRSFEATLQESLTGGGPAYLLLFDLDHFKQVNDCYGHESGNQVLLTIARLVRANTRADDCAFRYGGEEFAILLRHCSPAQAGQVAERLRRAVAEHPFNLADGRRIPVTISGGLVALRPHLPVGKQVAEADELLYRAKAAGRNRIESALGRLAGHM